MRVALIMVIENARGKKLLRLVSRVSGLVLQLVVFEVVSIDDGEPPFVRVLGYDPRTKVTATLAVDWDWVTEIAGGPHSLYLDKARRKELARIVIDRLVVIRRRGHPFELTTVDALRASKLKRDCQIAGEISTEDANSVLRRSGRIARFGVRISGLQLVVTFFAIKADSRSDETECDVAVNLYSVARSLSYELVISVNKQRECLRQPVIAFKEGNVRLTALRHVCKFLKVSFVQTVPDSKESRLIAELLPVSREFLASYDGVSGFHDVDLNIDRPLGFPVVFLPLSSCGDLIHQQVIQLPVEGMLLHMTSIMSVFTKAVGLSPEKGVVMRLYDSVDRRTITMHLGPYQLLQSCEMDPLLLPNLALAYADLEIFPKLDPQENVLESLTTRDDTKTHLHGLVQRLAELIVLDMRLRVGELDHVVPYFLSTSTV
jgi:hypothetical protein